MEVDKEIIRRYKVPVSTIFEDNKLQGVITGTEIVNGKDGQILIITTKQREE